MNSKNDELKKLLTGPVFTVFTAFKEDGKINYDQIESYLSYLHKKNVRKLYTQYLDNSRYSQLREKEILELNSFVISTVKNFQKDNLVIVNCIHGPTELSLDYGYKAFEEGADIFASIVREKYFSDSQIIDHYDLLSEKLKMPLLVHEMPFLSGYDAKNLKWPLSLFEQIKSIDNVIAIKEDAKDLDYGKR